MIVSSFFAFVCGERSQTQTPNLLDFRTFQPKQEARLGSQGSQSVTSHPFFETLDWDRLERGKLAVRHLTRRGPMFPYLMRSKNIIFLLQCFVLTQYFDFS